MRKLDYITLEALGRKGPGTSVIYLIYLYSQIVKGAVFHKLSEQDCNTIVDPLRSVDGFILSFDTFFEYCKCLLIWGQCAKLLKRGSLRGTAFTALSKAISQTSRSTNASFRKPNPFLSPFPGLSLAVPIWAIANRFYTSCAIIAR